MARYKHNGEEYYKHKHGTYKKVKEDLVKREIHGRWDPLVEIANNWYRNAYEDTAQKLEDTEEMLAREKENMHSVITRLRFWQRVCTDLENTLHDIRQTENLERRILHEVFEDEPEIRMRYRQIYEFPDLVEEADDDQEERELEEDRLELARERMELEEF